jgi:transcriptional regulator of acetoin/glycerol metabolism
VASRKLQTTAPSPVRRRTDDRGTRVRVLAQVHAEGDAKDEVVPHPLGDDRVIIGREGGVGRIAIEDPEASRKHAEIEWVPDAQTYRLKDLKSRNQTFLDGRIVESDYLQPGSVIRIGGTLFVYTEVTLAKGAAPIELEPGSSLERMHAEAQADLAAPTALSILISGPTGAGKEMLADRVHKKSGRKGPLVPVNCATFNRELLGSELFGHVAGAFSGAHSARNGLFAAANGGTLFLDEIAELPLDQQPALLRALQEGKIRPVGSDRELSVDVRVVAASHQKLEALAARDAFRSDLYARLAGFTIDLPGLTRRREEILALFRKFLGDRAPPLASDVAETLLLYDWPRNVRELKHAAERVKLVAGSADRVDAAALPREIKVGGPSNAENDDEAPSKAELERLLAEHDGNVAQVARALGKHRQQLYRWIKRHELDPASYRKEP